MADGPTYHRIADLLREEIRAGKWHPGDRLPSHSELADRMQVSITTARNAIQVLVAENLVYTATSRGTIVRNQEFWNRSSPTIFVPIVPSPRTTFSRRSRATRIGCPPRSSAPGWSRRRPRWRTGSGCRRAPGCWPARWCSTWTTSRGRGR
ncbi:winged helix-turn-helix domain-containing protein [Nocardia puris]|uniref:winged helix-turn-helix domain-containing protein n=1 Tax=Nocardia puris TaxID=208602 RepID=UPI001E550203|nr:winged helix-turn-helix domain-containing protein [Nocardia puris]